MKKFRQSFIVSEKPGILSENLKTLTSSNYPTVQYFLLKLRTRFLLANVCKRVCLIFFISFRSWVICKNLKRPGFYTLAFFTFINNSISKQNKKKSTPFCRHCQVENVWKILAKNIKLYGSWSSLKFSIFQTSFLEVIEVCLNWGIGFCITWLVLPTNKKIGP